MRSCNTLDEIRENIDRLDREIVSLIAKRGDCVREAAAFKATVEDVEAPKRVNDVIIKVRGLATDYGVDPDIVETIYRTMIGCFIDYEMKNIETRKSTGQRINDVISVIMNRRSVRLYDSKPIPRETLKVLIDAGNMAPTGGNAQNWRFVVVEDGGFKAKLLSLAIPRYKKWMEHAPAALSAARKDIDSVVADPIYYDAPVILFVIGSGPTGDFDSSMVCENVMLAARSLDIGSCWVYFGQLPLDDPEIRYSLELKEGEKIYGPILLGYPKESFPAPPKKKSAVVKWI